MNRLMHPTTAGDLVVGDCILAIEERGMGCETDIRILEVKAIEPLDPEWKLIGAPDRLPGEILAPDARATVVLRDHRGPGLDRELELHASTPLMATGSRI